MSDREVLLFLSVIPSIILGYIIYKKDIVEKEPKGLLIKLFLGGIGAVILTIFLSLIIEQIVPALKSENLTTLQTGFQVFFEIALIEEFSKWFFLKKNTWKSKDFNYLYDAIVYAVFVSLGFATIENILYVFDGGITTAIMRAITSVPGHTFFGVFMGYYYGLSKLGEINQKEAVQKKNMILSLLVPIILHFIFDFCLMAENGYLLLFYFIFIILLYINAFKKMNQLSKITKSMIPIGEDPTPKIRFCPNCGKEIKGKFCTQCGNQITK